METGVEVDANRQGIEGNEKAVKLVKDTVSAPFIKLDSCSGQQNSKIGKSIKNGRTTDGPPICRTSETKAGQGTLIGNGNLGLYTTTVP